MARKGSFAVKTGDLSTRTSCWDLRRSDSVRGVPTRAFSAGVLRKRLPIRFTVGTGGTIKKNKLQEMQELQRFLMARKGSLIAIHLKQGGLDANTYFVNVPDCKYNHVGI